VDRLTTRDHAPQWS